SERDIVLFAPVGSEAAFRAAISSLVKQRLVRSIAYAGQGFLLLSATGLLASKYRVQYAGLVRKLLAYFRNGTSQNGAGVRYNWGDLKDAGVVKEDSEFIPFINLANVLELNGSGMYLLSAAPVLNWGPPGRIEQLRKANNLRELVALLMAEQTPSFFPGSEAQ